MAAILVLEYAQLLTGSGTADGRLNVTSTAGYKVGAQAWLQGPANSPPSQLVKIDSIVSATQVQVIFIPEGINDVKLRTRVVTYPSTQHNDCTSYPINSTLSQFKQVTEIPATVPAF